MSDPSCIITPRSLLCTGAQPYQLETTEASYEGLADILEIM